MTTATQSPPAAEPLCEYVDSGGVSLRVDPMAGVLRGVKLIGLESKNGRRYQPTALQEATALYEGAKVNVNHPAGSPLAARDYRDRLGVVRSVEFRDGAGLFADLHFNPKHALAEQLAWDAEHCPQNVGLSHNVLARLARDGDAAVVEQITHVRSVDLVADRAATRGLFEHESPAWDALTVDVLRQHRPDLLEEIRAAETAAVREELADVKQCLKTLAEERSTTFAAPQSIEQRAAIGARETQTPAEFARSLKHPRRP